MGSNLDNAQRAHLLRLCDPNPGSRQRPSIKEEAVAPLLAAAQPHGVLPVVLRRLGEGGAFRDNPAFQRAQQHLVAVTGQVMILSHFAEQVSAALKSNGLRFAIVKGPSFAAHLYPLYADRPFTDVDFLVHVDDIGRANEIMPGLGLISMVSEDRPVDIYGEYKWEPPDGRKVLIELHANLMHSPKLRSSVSLSYATLLRAGNGRPEAPAAMLLVAALHGSLGHQFERLQLLVDVLQAARFVVSNAAHAEVVRACREVGAGLAVATALDLASTTFDEPRARELADEISRDRLRYVARRLLTPSLVAATQDESAWRRSWRRKVYRQILSRQRPA